MDKTNELKIQIFDLSDAQSKLQAQYNILEQEKRKLFAELEKLKKEDKENVDG